MDLVLCDHVSKTIGEKTILRDINLTISQNEIVGLIGPNGAGKTTLIRLISGLYKPTSGNITLRYSNIGVIPDKDGLYEQMTMREQLNFTSLLKTGHVLSQKGFDEIARTIQLDTDRKITTFSLGMKRRLSFGMLLIGKPDLIILDEPFIGLDPQGQESMQALIKVLSRAASILISSHSLELLDGLITRSVFINHAILHPASDVQKQSLKAQYFDVFKNVDMKR